MQNLTEMPKRLQFTKRTVVRFNGNSNFGNIRSTVPCDETKESVGTHCD
jgi:hypothetical protein